MLEAADFAYRIEDGAISLVKEGEEETSRKKETTTWEAANVQ
jgi:hypothetical protein